MTQDVKNRDKLTKSELDRELNDALKGTFPPVIRWQWARQRQQSPIDP